MGQKTSPIANRLGIIRGWESNWYAGRDAAAKLIEDDKIRKYIAARRISFPDSSKADARNPKGGISKVYIERTLKRVTVTIHTSRPGIIIGKGGKEVDNLKDELKKLTNKDVQINIVEIRRPEVDAYIVAETIAKQLEARINYRRAIKMAIASAERMHAEGIKIKIGGRIGGAEIARREEYKKGRTPLHTFRADIDFGFCEALTVYGKLGIKVWICRGEKYGKLDLVGGVTAEGQEETKQPRPRRDNRERKPKNG